MRKGFLAEEILALTTSRERAESIAGDLVEEAAVRGFLWHGWALAGVSLALFFTAFGAARAHTLRLLGRGLFVWCWLYFTLRIIGAVSGLQPLDVGRGSFAELAPAAQAYLAAVLMLAGVLTGIVLGRASTVNGMSAAAPLAAFWSIATLIAPLTDVLTGTATWYCTALYLTGLPLCYLFPLLAGGAFAGRRAAPADGGAHR